MYQPRATRQILTNFVYNCILLLTIVYSYGGYGKKVLGLETRMVDGLRIKKTIFLTYFLFPLLYPLTTNYL